MKKILYLVAICLFFAQCDEKKVEPFAIETVSAEINDDGSVLLTGRIVSDGGSSPSEIGFAYGTEADPGEDEILRTNATLNGKEFTMVLGDFDEKTKYYFRAYAKVSGVPSTGEIIMLENIIAKPVVAPCTPAINTVNHGTGAGFDNIKNIGASTSPIAWTISFSTSGYYYKMSFEKKPKTGIYSTVEDFKPEGKAAYILISNGISEYTVNKGAKVYVNKIADNKWDITVCEAPFFTVINSKFTLRVVCEE